ncbi:ATP-dependent DNA ligase [Naasia aerilata]|uniref:DNA ligase (ATP) n=1 Tax=Naasia aerilata TaxID=1162966 RepID=A0ABN6XVG5_9MICO|nr:ATP-dependent DNA ligase [Naasia aerilata]BDZ47655.1 ATP-dependent DNA ligase [Naasia aerilata]
MARSSGDAVVVDGRRLRLTHLDKVLYPETGTTKAEVIDYYARVAAVLLPHTRERPLTRKRWVNGVGTESAPGEVFFQKNVDDGAPDWIPRRVQHHKSHTIEYPLLNDRATLAWAAQVSSLELHVPQWRFDAQGTPQNPDRLVLDLDPGPGTGLQECAEIARRVRPILEGVGLRPFPVTSGSKGIHLYAHLDGSQTSDEISAFAHELARALEADDPDLIVSDMKKTLRVGKVLVDWSQNSAAKTTIAPYSLRGRAHPTVAAPRTWEELDDPGLAHLLFSEVLERVARDGDLLAALDPPRVLEPTPERMATFETTPESADRLAKYRSMRDASKTPEPVPAEPALPSDGQSFVIQEHHARRLHYDFRLERDGVLVSWAVPKGVPESVSENHLAVHTEDHPLEYGTFEGRIPAGEYGGGEVTIWDAGTYELEKWRDSEVIVTLHGRPGGPLGGPVRVALIRTGRAPGDEKNWLMHRMKPEHGSPAAAEPVVAAPGTQDPPSPVAESARGAAEADRSAIRDLLERGPMLATLGTEDTVGSGHDWAFEMKWDGIRALVEVRDGRVRVVSRNRNDLTAGYPELAGVPAPVSAGTALLDGEIVAIGRGGRPDFGLLQQRMNLQREADIQAARRSVPVHLMVFDLLEVDGRALLDRPYSERRELLARTVASTGVVQVPPEFSGAESTVQEALAASKELGLEGLVAKKRDSLYSAGRRSPSWVKIKHHLMQEVVIGGWRPGQGGRSGAIGSLLLGIPGDGGLTYVGKVGTGFTSRSLAEIGARLAPLEQTDNPFLDIPRPDAKDAHWVSPELVGEVEFAEWTGPGRLRQPSWRGWRTDKAPGDVVREDA